MIEASKLYRGFWVCATAPYHRWHCHRADDHSPVPTCLNGEFDAEADVCAVIDTYQEQQDALRKEAEAKAEEVKSLKARLAELTA